MKTFTKLPKAVKCVSCRATHGATVYRLKQDPKFWLPCRPWTPELYELKPEKIDLMQSELCARCLRDAPPVAPKQKAQGSLF